MARESVWTGILVGLLVTAPVVGTSYLVGSATGLPFPPYRTFEWLTRILPGPVVTWGIDAMLVLIRALQIGPTSEIAKIAEKALAVGLYLVGGAVAGGVVAVLARWWRPVVAGLVIGGIALVAGIGIEAALGFPGAPVAATVVWLAVLYTGWGAGVGASLSRAAASREAPPGARRRFLALLGGGAVLLAGLTTGLGRLLRRRAGTVSAGARREILDPGITSGPAASPPAEILAARPAPAPGTRPEITRNADFYRIDINLSPPRIDAASWRLVVEGLVARRLVLTLDELRSRQAFTQAITLECISNPVGGDLISTGLWTGVRLKDILTEAGLLAGARAVFVEAADGFYETVVMGDAKDERTLLVFHMNGLPLPVEHGFPLRIYIPDRHGMKQPKWIRRLEVTDRERPGYWVERGWSREAVPKTTSVIDTVGTGMMVGEKPTLPVGGIAYAGARGISRVEVQVDGGPWVEARLLDPPLGPLTWVRWRYDWPYEGGQHIFRVRAYDGRGVLQPVEAQGPRPDGAAGIHSITRTV